MLESRRLRNGVQFLLGEGLASLLDTRDLEYAVDAGPVLGVLLQHGVEQLLDHDGVAVGDVFGLLVQDVVGQDGLEGSIQRILRICPP